MLKHFSSKGKIEICRSACFGKSGRVEKWKSGEVEKWKSGEAEKFGCFESETKNLFYFYKSKTLGEAG